MASFPEGDFEDLLVAVLSQDVGAIVSLECRLFLIGTVDAPRVVVHFGKD